MSEPLRWMKFPSEFSSDEWRAFALAPDGGELVRVFTISAWNTVDFDLMFEPMAGKEDAYPETVEKRENTCLKDVKRLAEMRLEQMRRREAA